MKLWKYSIAIVEPSSRVSEHRIILGQAQRMIKHKGLDNVGILTPPLIP